MGLIQGAFKAQYDVLREHGHSPSEAFNETVEEALKRELEEEIGLVPELTKLNPIDVYQSKDKNFMYYSFVYVTDKEFIPTLNNESSGYAWVNIGNWPKPLHDGARNTLARNKGIDKLHTILNINSK